MHLRTLIIVAAIAHASVAAHGQMAPPNSEQTAFQSVTFDNFRQLLARDPPTATVTVRASLSFPSEAKDQYPAVVVVHTIAGYIDANEGEMAAELRKAGFATLTYDSFAARGTTGLAQSRLGPGLWPTGVADAYGALRLLENNPRIDPNRIAIVGFSYGGEVAHLTAFEAFHAALHAGQGRFSGHVAFYPAGVFGAIPNEKAYTGSPVLMLLGEKDDNLPVTKVKSYLDYAHSAGHPPPIETVTYADAYHAWTVPSLVTLRFYPEYGSTKKCPLLLLGQNQPTFLIDGHEKPFDPSIMRKCMSEAPGYSMLYNEKIRAQSTDDAIAFLNRILQL